MIFGVFMKFLNILKVIICFCLVFPCFYSFGEENSALDSEFASIYKRLPENIETAHLRWKIGLAVYSEDKYGVTQIPLMAELKMPFSVRNPDFKWLVQMGPGWMWTHSYYKICKSNFILDPFDSPLVYGVPVGDEKLVVKNGKVCLEEWKKKTEDSFPYFLFQPGLSYNFGSLTGLLKGGVLISWSKKPGAVATLSIGSDWWDMGLQALYYDRLYFGFALTAGYTLKKWQVKNPYKREF